MIKQVYRSLADGEVRQTGDRVGGSSAESIVNSEESGRLWYLPAAFGNSPAVGALVERFCRP
jgi:hypothetical protein